MKTNGVERIAEFTTKHFKFSEAQQCRIKNILKSKTFVLEVL